MSKKIVVNNCTECPFIQHHGGFGNPAYIPYCSKAMLLTDGNLPYTTSSRVTGGCKSPLVTAIPTGVIPDWCPLEDNGE